MLILIQFIDRQNMNLKITKKKKSHCTNLSTYDRHYESVLFVKLVANSIMQEYFIIADTGRLSTSLRNVTWKMKRRRLSSSTCYWSCISIWQCVTTSRRPPDRHVLCAAMHLLSNQEMPKPFSSKFSSLSEVCLLLKQTIEHDKTLYIKGKCY